MRPETNITTREENPDNLVEAPIQVIDTIASKISGKEAERDFCACSSIYRSLFSQRHFEEC